MWLGKTNEKVGIIVISLNLILCFISLYFLYCYNFTDRLFLFMYPNSVLLINFLLGIVGIFISILLYKKVVSIRLFLILTFLLWLITLSIFFVMGNAPFLATR